MTNYFARIYNLIKYSNMLIAPCSTSDMFSIDKKTFFSIFLGPGPNLDLSHGPKNENFEKMKNTPPPHRYFPGLQDSTQNKKF